MSKSINSSHTEPLLPGQADHKDHEDTHGSATRGSAIFNVVCTIAGTGILQLPDTLRLSGWTGLAIMIMAAFVADYTGKVVIHCLYYEPGKRLAGYPEIGQAAFGKFGYYAVHFFHKSTLLGVCALFFILAALNLDSIFESWNLGTTNWSLICAALIWAPVAFLKNMKEISLMSLFGMLASMVVVIVVVVMSLVDLPNNRDQTHEPIVFATLGSAFAAMTFSYGGNAVYPHVEQSMKTPSQFNSVITISMLLVTLMYIPTAVVGYFVYGNSTVSPILNNLPDHWATTMALVVITLHVLLAYPIPMMSVVTEAEPTIEALSKRMQSSMGSKAAVVVLRALYRSSLIGLTLLVAILVPHFAEFMTLLGAVCNCMLVFVLPVIFNWRLRGFKSQKIYEQIYGMFILAVGLVGGFFGAYDAIKALIALENSP